MKRQYEMFAGVTMPLNWQPSSHDVPTSAPMASFLILGHADCA